MDLAPDRPAARTAHWAGWLLGFALGGFFDGILLHQILQWHHLLSAVPGEALRDLRVQVLADGLFHALMYVLALIGLGLLWRGQRLAGGRRLLGDALIGFGAWHIVDAVVSHWTLGLHRIRMESEAPLAWDLVFFALGLAALGAGLALRRGGDAGGAGGGRGRAAAALALALVVPAAGLVAARPVPGAAVAVWWGPGVEPAAALAAVAGLDGRPVAASGGLWLVALPEGADRGALYGAGAV
ncbi:MAG TPA: DUF2243 domain-containing protein, partial [Alphaproteobacteria bacterium]|nr:DUF2243 domain-containing protein [Alphaproteobacteria bacterium]